MTSNSNSFQKRAVRLRFQMRTGTVLATEADVVSLKGHRMEAMIERSGANLGAGVMSLRVWGVNKEIMNQFATDMLNPFQVRGDLVSLEVLQEAGGSKFAFEGTMLSANMDFSGAPDVSFNVFARSGYWANVAPAAPNSYRGSASVANILEVLAKLQGWSFMNYGVTTMLSNPYLSGTAWDQIQKIASAAGIAATVENNTLHIWPANGMRGDDVLEVSASNGMLGYPTFKLPGIEVRTIYNPELAYGKQVRITSEAVPKANGVFKIFQVNHQLSTNMPDGPWFSTIGVSKNTLFTGLAP